MFDFLGGNLTTIMEILTSVVGLFALIATLTPNTSDNAIADSLLRAVNTLGANIGRARNSS